MQNIFSYALKLSEKKALLHIYGVRSIYNIVNVCTYFNFSNPCYNKKALLSNHMMWKVWIKRLGYEWHCTSNEPTRSILVILTAISRFFIITFSHVRTWFPMEYIKWKRVLLLNIEESVLGRLFLWSVPKALLKQ